MAKRSLKKITLTIVGTVALLVVVALVGIRLALPGIIKGQIEDRGTEMLGVSVTVGNVGLSLLGGAVTLDDLSIAAPSGFPNTTLLNQKRVHANVGVLSLLSDTIIVEEISTEGTAINLDVTKDGKQSLRTLVEQLQANLEAAAPEAPEGEEPPGAPGEEAAPSKGIVIVQLTVADVRVAISDAYAATHPINTRIALGEFALENAGMPAPGKEADFGSTTMRLGEFSLTAPDRFTIREIATVGEFAMSVDAGKLFSTLQTKPEITLESITSQGGSFALENTDPEMPVMENVEEVTVAALNATSLEDPQTLEEYRAAKAEAAEGNQVAQAEEPAEESGGLFGKLKSATNKAADAAGNLKETLTPGEDEPVEEAPAEELPFEYAEISTLDVQGFQFTQLSITEDGPNRISSTVAMNGNEIFYPYRDGTKAFMEIQATTKENELEEWSAQVNTTGALTDQTLERRIDITADINKLPLAGRGAMTSGYLTMNFQGPIEDGAISGKATIFLEDFDYDPKKSGIMQNASLASVKTLSGKRIPEIKFTPIPIRNATPAEIMTRMMSSLSKAAAGSLTGASDQMKEALTELGDDLPEDLKGVTESKHHEDAKEAIEGAADKAGDTIKGLFGKKKDD